MTYLVIGKYGYYFECLEEGLQPGSNWIAAGRSPGRTPF